MREYIRCTERAAVMLFRRGSEADYARVDAIDAHNQGIATRVYNGLMDGSISHAYSRDHRRIVVYTRSNYPGIDIQASHFAEINGDWVATSHQDINNPTHLNRTLIPGRYITIA